MTGSTKPRPDPGSAEPRRSPARDPTAPAAPAAPRLSEQLEHWTAGDGQRTLGSLVDVFADGSFAVLFVVLLAVPALPLPTGGVTHVMELVAGLVALELLAGRPVVWLPKRWRAIELTGPRQQRFTGALIRLIKRLERHSRPRMAWLFNHRVTDVVFGLLVLVGTAGAFLAPPFSGLDTLPALSVVVMSVGVLLEDVLVVLAGMVLCATGIGLELALGAAVFSGISSIL